MATKTGRKVTVGGKKRCVWKTPNGRLFYKMNGRKVYLG